MIYIPVSEAYGFDHYSILCVKIENGLDAGHDMASVGHALFDQMGTEGLSNVLVSDEFEALMQANRQVWKMVGKASRDECKASEVDEANQSRYAAKQALQKRFWPDRNLTELKAKRPNE